MKEYNLSGVWKGEGITMRFSEDTIEFKEGNTWLNGTYTTSENEASNTRNINLSFGGLKIGLWQILDDSNAIFKISDRNIRLKKQDN